MRIMMDYRAKIRDYASIIDDLFEKYQDDPIPAAHRLDEADCGKLSLREGVLCTEDFIAQAQLKNS